MTERIPNYVQILMNRAKYNFSYEHENYGVGYTIEIEKSTPYAFIDALSKEMVKLKKWVEKQPGGKMDILYLPDVTHYRRQYAIISIWDPVMIHLEKYIPGN
jgi:hypothetical protein